VQGGGRRRRIGRRSRRRRMRSGEGERGVVEGEEGWEELRVVGGG
jgi:hypothetical protein